jgi:MoxR-like ATPase
MDAHQIPTREEAERLGSRDLLALARQVADQRGEPRTWLASASKSAMLAYIFEGTTLAGHGGSAAAEDPRLAAAKRIEEILGSIPTGIDEPTVRGIVAEAEERMIDRLAEGLNGATRPIQVVTPEGQPAGPVIEGAHRSLKSVLEYAALSRGLMLVGPTGSGKTSVAIDAARALGAEERLVIVGCDETQTAADLIGYLLPSGEWVDGPVTRSMRDPQGGVLVLDEVDNGSANTLNALNSALSHGILTTPRGAVRAPESWRVFLTANTYGGGGDWMYAGRNTLDAAFLDRFAGNVLYVDYDVATERRIIGCLGDSADDVARVIWAIRDRVAAATIARPVGTRWFVAAARMASLFKGLAAPKDRKAFVKQVMRPWTEEEREKALDGVEF